MKYLKFNYIFLIILFIGFESCKDNDEEPSEMHAELNLQTLEAETAFGTLKAKRAEKSYVGLLEGDQAIGVSFTNDITSGGNNTNQVAVHLYNGDELAMLIGEVDSNGEGTFESEAISDFDASVKITIKEDAVSGKAFFPGKTIPFTVQKATGNAGVYWAWGTGQESDISGYWVVLSDESQWGCICFPPYTSPCCEMQRL